MTTILFVKYIFVRNKLIDRSEMSNSIADVDDLSSASPANVI